MSHMKVYGMCEDKCLVPLINKRFTYEVNSDASLEYWLTNKASGTSSGGDDFTSVLIRKGEWKFTGIPVALDIIGTLHIEGETGSILTFLNTASALKYRSIQSNSSCYNVTVNCTGNDINYGVAFRCFNNLINCTGISDGIAFDNCSNLTNCTGISEFCGFYTCTNVINCTGTGTGNYNGYAYANCKVVHGCKAGGHCGLGVFMNCYASYSNTSTYAVADTANGGFNNTTNPAV